MNDLNVYLPCTTVSLDLIIPTHNRAALLKQCLNSVQAATIPDGLNVTVFVVDNNSTDDTKEVVQQYRGVQYIFVGRAGKSAALNDALAQTTGELVGLIDDDEQIDPTWFQVVHREFLAAPTLSFIGGPYFPNWEKTPPDWVPDLYNGAIGVIARSDSGSDRLKRQQYVENRSPMLMGGNAVIRRSVLEKVLPYPEHLGKIGKKIRSGEDEVIYHRLLKLGEYGVVVPDLIILHWVPTDRLTKKYYRKWVVGRGIAQGYQLRERGFPGAKLFGLPRYRFREFIQGCVMVLTSLSGRSRFTAQLIVLDFIALIYGFHFYE